MSFFIYHHVVTMKTHATYYTIKNIIQSVNPILASAQVLWVMNESQNGACH